MHSVKDNIVENSLSKIMGIEFVVKRVNRIVIESNNLCILGKLFTFSGL
jgi:hypothetical protein